MMKVRFVTAALLASALALSACQKKEEAATDAAAADAAAPAAADAATPAVATTALPAECNAYTQKVEACVARLSASNLAVADQFRTSMEQTRASWAAITDQAALGQACAQADAAFASTATAAGC